MLALTRLVSTIWQRACGHYEHLWNDLAHMNLEAWDKESIATVSQESAENRCSHV